MGDYFHDDPEYKKLKTAGGKYVYFWDGQEYQSSKAARSTNKRLRLAEKPKRIEPEYYIDWFELDLPADRDTLRRWSEYRFDNGYIPEQWIDDFSGQYGDAKECTKNRETARACWNAIMRHLNNDNYRNSARIKEWLSVGEDQSRYGDPPPKCLVDSNNAKQCIREIYLRFPEVIVDGTYQRCFRNSHTASECLAHMIGCAGETGKEGRRNCLNRLATAHGIDICYMRILEKLDKQLILDPETRQKVRNDESERQKFFVFMAQNHPDDLERYLREICGIGKYAGVVVAKYLEECRADPGVPGRRRKCKDKMMEKLRPHRHARKLQQEQDARKTRYGMTSKDGKGGSAGLRESAGRLGLPFSRFGDRS